jgi:hypothetical protein
MADFRQIHTRIWKDDWFSEIPLDAKLFFIYLFSNEQAEVGGVYELPSKYMAFEVGISQERILELLGQFEAVGKVFYRCNWVWVVNLRKYNETKSESVVKRIQKDLDLLPDGDLKKMYCKYYKIPYGHPVDTVSTPELNPQQGIDTRFKSASETDTERKGEDTEESEISMAFTAATSIMPYELDDWCKANQTLKGAGVLPEDVTLSVDRLKSGDKPMSVTGLWSVVKTAIAIHADRVAGRPIGSGNGSKPKSHRRGIADAINES